MFTGIIAVVLMLCGIGASISNGNWWHAVIMGVIAAFVLAMGAGMREQDRAYNNFVHYWSTGEFPQKQSGPYVPREKSAFQQWREARAAKKRREKFMDERDAEFREKGRRELVDCPTCGRRSKPLCRLVTVNKEDVWQCQCPFCGATLTRPHWRTKS